MPVYKGSNHVHGSWRSFVRWSNQCLSQRNRVDSFFDDFFFFLLFLFWRFSFLFFRWCRRFFNLNWFRYCLCGFFEFCFSAFFFGGVCWFFFLCFFRHWFFLFVFFFHGFSSPMLLVFVFSSF